MSSSESKALERLTGIMDELREKCPWDKKQTIETLRPLTIEETYELAEAIAVGDWDGIREELGDLLLHIVFYARIGKEEEKFTLDEVINSICDKLIARHPHVYGNIQVEDEEEVKRNWEKIKLSEGKSSVISGVPKALPATVKAMRLQEKAKQTGFEWQHRDQVWEKVEEEVDELKQAISEGNQEKIEEEYGDLIFSLINYARFLQVDAELALERTNRKFISRFQKMEKRAMEQGKKLDEMTLQEMDAIWNKIKHQGD